MTTPHDVPEEPAGPAPEPKAQEPQEPAPTAQDPHEVPVQDEPHAQEPAPAFAPPQSESAKFFLWLRGLGIRRGSNRWLGGVCSGLADKWGIDPVIVHGLAVVLTLFFGVGLLAYGVAWALLPEPDGRIHVEEVARGRWSAGMTGAGITTLLGLGGSGTGAFRDGDWFFWPVIWVGGVAWLIYWVINRDKTKNARSFDSGAAPQQGAPGPEAGQQPGQSWYGHSVKAADYGPRGSANPTSPTMFSGPTAPYIQQPYLPTPQMHIKKQVVKNKPRLGAAGSFLVIGAAAVVGAAVLLLDAGNVIHLGGYEAGVAAAAAAITAGLGIVAAGMSGRTAGGLGTFAVLALMFAGLLSLPANNTPVDAFNNTSWTPSSVAAAEDGRTVVLGNATFDLTQLGDGTALSADVDVPLKAVTANMSIMVPAGIPVTVKSELAAAQFSIDGKNDGGVLTQDMTSTINPSATGYGLVITLQAVASNIDIVTVPAAP